MPTDWGPHVSIKDGDVLSGKVILTEKFNKESFVEALRIMGGDLPNGYHGSNPWARRPVGFTTWELIGNGTESDKDYAVEFDTTKCPNGDYEILASMWITASKTGKTYIRERITRVSISN